MPKDIGGQAVIEGVMMRNKLNVVTAVRKKGKIIYKHDRLKKRPKYWSWPLLRGVLSLFDMVVVGTKTLNWSANQQTDDEEELTPWTLALTITLSFAFALGLFLLLPYALTYLTGLREEVQPILFNVVDSIIKLGVLVLYLYTISKWKEIYRVFQYHGAEHKAVFCYEAKLPLTVKNAKKFTTFHPRCGTSFIVITIIVSIFLFSFIPQLAEVLFPWFPTLSWWGKRGVLFVLRILLLPAVAAVSYEILKAGASRQKNPFFRALTLPGLWVQRITTKEPTQKQLEVGLASLRKLLASR